MSVNIGNIGPWWHANRITFSGRVGDHSNTEIRFEMALITGQFIWTPKLNLYRIPFTNLTHLAIWKQWMTKYLTSLVLWSRECVLKLNGWHSDFQSQNQMVFTRWWPTIQFQDVIMSGNQMAPGIKEPVFGCSVYWIVLYSHHLNTGLVRYSDSLFVF
jgi:hypothetical protein